MAAPAFADVRGRLHWPAPAVQALVTLNDRPAALLADAPPDHATRFALHLEGQVLPLAQAPAGAVYGAMQDVIAAGDDPVALLPALVGAVQRDLAAVAHLPGQFLDALTAEGKKVLLSLLGPQVTAELDKTGSLMAQILADPLKFFANLAYALERGFGDFVHHIGDHLKNGLMTWLGRVLGSLYVDLPPSFDLAGVVSIGLQVLNLTYSHLRGLLVAKLGKDGEARVAAMERGWSFLMTLASPTGLAAALGEFQKFAGMSPGELLGIVKDGIMDWMKGQLIASVTEHLLSLCTGAGSIVAAIASIYKAITFFLDNRDYLVDLANQVLGALTTIARGAKADLDKAGDKIEATMAATLPLLIDFLARQFGLGDIGAEVHAVVEKIQNPITTMEDHLVDLIVGQAHRFPIGTPTPGHNSAVVGESVDASAFPQDTFQTDEETHTIFIAMKGAHPVIMIASTPNPLVEFLDTADKNPNIDQRFKVGIPDARVLVAEMATLVDEIAAERRAGKKADDPTVRAKYAEVAGKEDKIAKILKRVLSKVDIGEWPNDDEFVARYKLEGLVATYRNMPVSRDDDFTPDHQLQSKLLKHVAGLAAFTSLYIKDVVGTEAQQSPGGYCINLSLYRHQAGRTFSYKSNGDDGSLTLAKADVNRRVAAAGSDPVEQRKAAIEALQAALALDVADMKRVAQSNNPGVWQDIHDLKSLKDVAKATLIERIREQILAGEDRIANQNLDRLQGPRTGP